jgi:hypothetical protein
MPNDLYEHDILEWSERQADLLRRVANGERRNAVDWPNVIEEIADVGSAQLNSVRGCLRQAMIHLLKIHLAPDDLAREHWLTELDAFLDDAAERFSPSMRQRIDLGGVFAKARARVLRRVSDQALPATCPWTLDELLAGDADALIAAIPDSSSSPQPA